jgi:UDP-N-acetyl-D-glucosamine dehydrogenase
LRPILEARGLKAGEDFFLAFSPEREDPGNPHYSTSTIPKVVGGVDASSGELAVALYKPAVTGVVPVTSAEVAEACKILENTYRAVNIALVNELKIVFDAMKIDVWEVIAAAKTKPFGFQAFYPGPGLGGHCIPIDPFYLTWAARRFGVHTRFIELAGEVNTSMPRYVVQRVAEALNADGKSIKGSRICVLGVAYKKDVDDPRESPAFEIMEMLERQGAELSYSDPHVPSLPKMRHHHIRLNSSQLTDEFLTTLDCALIITEHKAFDFKRIAQHARLIVDTRNATAGIDSPKARIVKA